MPEDYLSTVKDTLKAFDGSAYQASAQEIAKEMVTSTSDNNAKISDHFAIIPTPVGPAKPRDDEQKIYDMVTRFLAVFYPAAEYRLTTRTPASRRMPRPKAVLVFPGWLAVYGKGSPGKTRDIGCGAKRRNQTTEIEIAENQTKPPP